MGMEIDPVAKCLDDGDDAGHKRAPGHDFKVTGQGAEGQAAEIPQKPAVVLEEEAEHLGDGEGNLAVRDVQEKFLPHPLAPLLKPFGMTGGAESPVFSNFY